MKNKVKGERNMLQGENWVQVEKRFWKGGKTVPKGGGKRNLEGEEKVSRVRKRGW